MPFLTGTRNIFSRKTENKLTKSYISPLNSTFLNITKEIQKNILELRQLGQKNNIKTL